MQELTFSTPPKRRSLDPITVDLCGETITVNRPKDAALRTGASISADSIVPADRAAAILAYMQSVLSPEQYKQWLERCKDTGDTLNLSATMDLVSATFSRWARDEFDPDDAHVTITDTTPLPEDTCRVVSRDFLADVGEDAVDILLPEGLDVDLVFHRPKEIVNAITSSALAANANAGQMSWCVGFYLDATLSPQDAMVVEQRFRSQDPDDLLDLGHMAEVAQALIRRWAPHYTASNRAQRRAAARAS